MHIANAKCKNNFRLVLRTYLETQRPPKCLLELYYRCQSPHFCGAFILPTLVNVASNIM